eukprot:13669009-Alexandrium_andersonii.AAC.1
MATFIFNRSPEMVERAKKIIVANQEWGSLNRKFDLSWAVKLGAAEPAQGEKKPTPKDYCYAWNVYCEAV